MSRRSTEPKTANTELTRQVNRSLVLDHIKLRGPTGITALAQASGLHRTTVYSRVRELVHEGILTLGPTVQPRTGRPGALVTLNQDGHSIIGAQLGIKYVQAVVSDLEGKILHKAIREIDPRSGFEAIYRELVLSVTEAVADARRRGRAPMGIGIAVPGLVDETEGRILLSANLGWRNTDLGRLLRAEFHLPVWVRNGAHAALLGERYFGIGRDLNDWVYLTVGAELAAGFFLRGNVYLGTTGYAGEIGHTIVQPEGIECTCGNHGCWEALASERALIRYYREAGGSEELTLDGIVARATAGDAPSVVAIERVARYLAIGIVNLLHTLNPECIVVGGELANADHSLLDRIDRYLQQYHLFSRGAPRSLLKASRLPIDAALLGAVSIVLHNTLDGPRIV